MCLIQKEKKVTISEISIMLQYNIFTIVFINSAIFIVVII